MRELGRSYRRAASDLAIARVESRDQRLVNYLNNLVIRAHGMVYRGESKGFRSMLEFYWHDFPAIFRRTYRYTLATFLTFVAIAVVSFIATWRNDDFADFAYLPGACGAADQKPSTLVGAAESGSADRGRRHYGQQYRRQF